MTSQLRMVERRCATAMVVRVAAASSSAFCTIFSLWVSSADVASSSSSRRGFRIRARATAMRCRWPPENCRPLEPQFVWRPSGSEEMNSSAFACRQASVISASVGSCARPSAMFSRIEFW